METEAEIQYEFNNTIYTIVGTDELHQQLQSDPKIFAEYVAAHASELETKETLETEDPNTYSQDEETFVWTSKNIFLLLDELEKLKLDLRNPRVKKRDIWRRIQENMSLEGVQNITEDIIERKYRNMKHTFKNIQENSSEKTKIKWMYYDAMEKLFSEDWTIKTEYAATPTTTICGDQDEDFVWTSKNIFLLLDEVDKVKTDLGNPKIKKRGVWRRVKNNMCLKGVQNISEDFLERKFRNMKATFKNIKENAIDKREIKWRYYDAMEKIFEGDNSLNIDGNTLRVNVIDDGDSVVWSSRKPPRRPRSPAPSGRSDSPTPRKAKNTARYTQSPTPSDGLESPIPSGGSESPTPSGWQDTPSPQERKQKAEKAKQLYGLRKRQLEVEESRLQELALFRKAIEENNKLQEERNVLLKELLKKQK